MCRSCNEGGRRCASDSSLKRRLRRKTSQVKENHTPVEPNREPGTVEPLKYASVDDLKKEAQSIASLTSAPVLEDEKEQDLIDSQIEARLTALGMAIGEEAEKRASFDIEKFKEEYDETSEEYETATINLMEALDEVETLQEDIETAKQEGDKEKLAQLEDELETAEVKLEEAQTASNLADKEDYLRREKLISATLSSLSNAYQEVLSEIRPLGGKVNITDYSDIKAGELLQETVGTVYPSEWLQQSNQAEDGMRVLFQECRSHYNDEAVQADLNSAAHPEFTVEESEGNYIYHVPEDKAFQLVERLGGDAGVFDARPVLINGEYCRMVRVPQKTVFNPEVDKVNADGTPAGDGWSLEYYVSSDDLKTVPSEKVWVKSSNVKRVKLPELVISSSADEGELKAIAFHEFGHRMETIVGNGVIMRQEEAWLRRRTTNASTGEREDNSYIYPPLPGGGLVDQEIGRRNSFFHHYVGKEYVTGRHREVFSMGVESLFGGSYFGMLGLNSSVKTDKDHRGFILGLLASV